MIARTDVQTRSGLRRSPPTSQRRTRHRQLAAGRVDLALDPYAAGQEGSSLHQSQAEPTTLRVILVPRVPRVIQRGPPPAVDLGRRRGLADRH